MKSLVRWAITNTPAMNTLMVALLIAGGISLYKMRREVFPEFDLEIILVQVPYPGASPEEVEEGICQKIEEAVRSINGIKKQTAVAAEGMGSLVLELEIDVDPKKVLSEVRSEIDRIPSFPELAEDPEVKQLTIRESAIQVGVIGPDRLDRAAELRLRDVAELVREDLIQLSSISQANIVGAKDYQIDVEIAEDTLRRYGLTLQEVSRIIRSENIELPAGTIRTESQDVLVKGKDKGTTGTAIESIPLVTRSDGVVLTVGDLGVVRDDFSDITTSLALINGRPGIAVSVDRTADEDILVLTSQVKEYVATKKLPEGFSLVTWGDRSVEVKDRMDLLVKNGAQGLVLVLITLALFLDLRLAFWVAAGIPISILGAIAILLYCDQTLNMVSMFAILMALGIVVDDAIVVGENIYTHRQQGSSFLKAAIDGTVEVIPSVAASVATTIIAFLPMMFVSGVLGKFIAVMPLAMIAILLISLAESSLVLPCHLGHEIGSKPWLQWAREYRASLPWVSRNTYGASVVGAVFLATQFAYPFQRFAQAIHRVPEFTNNVLEFLVDRYYRPILRVLLDNTTASVFGALSILLLTGAFVSGGHIQFTLFPKLDSNNIEASIVYPDGTPSKVTAEATKRIEDAILEINRQFAEKGKPVVDLTRRAIGYTTAQTGPGQTSAQLGNHRGSVSVELVDATQRPISSLELVRQWRKLAGDFPGAETVIFGSTNAGPGGTPIEFKLLSKTEDSAKLEEAVERCKAKLADYPGVFDISDDSSPGKWEFQLRVKDNAKAMGVSLEQLAQTVRGSYYGEEVMRLQRGRHEVKLMVRYPSEERTSFANFDQIRVRGNDGAERPLTELADVRVHRGYTEINRVDQLRSITISADVDEAEGNTYEIVKDMRARFTPGLLEELPGVSIRWEGQQEQMAESMQSLLIGSAVAMLAMFVVLTLEFNSYAQPLLILIIIPFGCVGAVLGHAVMGLPLTLFSVFGLIALTGVVVNDSIVLVDFINHHINEGMPLHEALLESGRRRLRPILLTSLTTVAGMGPMVFETSFQAQLLIPMAVSLCGGLIMSTSMVLFLVPVFYNAYANIVPSGGKAKEHTEIVTLQEVA